MSKIGKTLVVTLALVPTLSILSNIVYSKIGGIFNVSNMDEMLPTSEYGTGLMFDKIASRYDFINRALALNLDMGWRRVMVDEVTDSGELFTKQNKAKLLDLATGTADVAILLGQAATKKQQELEKEGMATTTTTEIRGVDPSNNMIEIGKTKVSDQNLSNIVTLEIGDATNLKNQFSDNTFDAVTMSFGIRNVPEKEKALCEIHRVMKKENAPKNISSKLCIMEFSEPEGNTIMGAGAKFFIKYIVPVVGAILSGAPKEYLHLQNSIKNFPSPNEFKYLMENLECGKKGRGTFRVEEVKNLNFGSVQIYVAQPILRK